MAADLNWLVYMIRCTDQSLYTGITTDIERRFKQHCSGKGAKYFYGREPESVAYVESTHSRSSASKREAEIKKLTKLQKEKLIAESAIPND